MRAHHQTYPDLEKARTPARSSRALCGPASTLGSSNVSPDSPAIPEHKVMDANLAPAHRWTCRDREKTMLVRSMGRLADLIRSVATALSDAPSVRSRLPPDVWSWSDFEIQIDPRTWRRLISKLEARSWPGPIVVEGVSLWCLDGGMGPATYISEKGRVAVVHEAPLPISKGDAYCAMAVAARRSGIDEFLLLQPSKPTDAEACAACAGSRFAPWPGALDESEARFVCSSCDGLGWVSHAAGTD